jgi:hypothetical protein
MTRGGWGNKRKKPGEAEDRSLDERHLGMSKADLRNECRYKQPGDLCKTHVDNWDTIDKKIKNSTCHKILQVAQVAEPVCFAGQGSGSATTDRSVKLGEDPRRALPRVSPVRGVPLALSGPLFAVGGGILLLRIVAPALENRRLRTPCHNGRRPFWVSGDLDFSPPCPLSIGNTIFMNCCLGVGNVPFRE